MLPKGVSDSHRKYVRVSQLLDNHFKSCNSGPKVNFFSPKLQYNVLKTFKWRKIVATLHMQQDFPVPKGPLRPSNATICRRTATKRPPKALELVYIGRRHPGTKNRPYLGLCGSKPDFERT